uniref:Uncharacterized protein n=1 Tax=Anguilla anguilla TaxID=7936 RepID=A0A0E9W9U4_ANGAN
MSKQIREECHKLHLCSIIPLRRGPDAGTSMWVRQAEDRCSSSKHGLGPRSARLCLSGFHH